MKFDFALTPQFSALRNADPSQLLTNLREVDITYHAEPTDDGKHVYVTVKQDAQ